MKQIFKTEMKRAMSGKGMVLSMLIGTVLGIAHVIREIIPAYRANLTNFYNEFPILSPHSAVETWMAGSPSNLEGFIFFLILPILASLPKGIIKKVPKRSNKKYLYENKERRLSQSKICCCFSERGNCSSCSIDFQFNVQSGSSAKLSTAFNNGR